MLPMKRPFLGLLMLCSVLSGCGGTKSAADAGMEMTLDGALANRFVKADQIGSLTARLRIASHTPVAKHAAPVNVALVIDTSGSMEGRPIEDARAAGDAMIDTLSDGDHLAVVAFSSRVEVLLPSTELDGGNRRKAHAGMAAMKAEGTTDLAGGLRKGIDEVLKNLDPHGVNRIVLCGDGVPNDESLIRSLAQEAARSAVPITALGLGPDYNETLMGAVAQLSGGQFHYVRESSEVASFFKNEVLRLKQVYARNATLTVQPGPGVMIDSIVGQPFSREASGVRLSLGDISRADTRDLVVKLTAPGHRNGASVEVLDAVLDYEDAWGESGHVERRVFLGAHATGSDADLAKGRNPDVEDTAATVEAAAKMVQAIGMVREGNEAGAREVLNQAAEQADQDAKVNSNAVLREQSRSIKALGDAIPSPSPAAAAPMAGAGMAAAPAMIRPIAAPKKSVPAPMLLKAHDDAMRVLQ
jgi:Ca-activated chloride channel homolog